MQDLNPSEVAERLAKDPKPTLLDVRLDWELKLASIDGALQIPMHEVPERLAELDQEAQIIVFCHAGKRSAMIARFLEQSGYCKVFNMAGGIDAWSRDVDPEVPCY